MSDTELNEDRSGNCANYLIVIHFIGYKENFWASKCVYKLHTYMNYSKKPRNSIWDKINPKNAITLAVNIA